MSLRSINKIKNLGGSVHPSLILLRGGNELLPPRTANDIVVSLALTVFLVQKSASCTAYYFIMEK